MLSAIVDEGFVQRWMGIITALFLVGAALGGLIFGWLGDRIGRVKAMTWSILFYSGFTGLCYFATAPWHLGALRFVAALGMGGEWALGVALVMECWPEGKRPLMAGLIGASANLGYCIIAVIGIAFPITQDSWRWVMMVGAAPALLTFLLRLFVPESEKWKAARRTGGVSPAVEIFSPALMKNTLLAITYFCTYWSTRLITGRHPLALLAALSLLFVPQISWESQRDLTHTVLASTLASVTVGSVPPLL